MNNSILTVKSQKKADRYTNPSLAVWCAEVQNFRELEARIAALPDEHLRGNVFELFAQAYLSVRPSSPASCVWLARAVPESVRARFNGALDRDNGIDGVLQTRTSDLHAYQVKFRTGRRTLSWSELSTFVGLTEEFEGRFVFTNSEEVAPIVTQRRGLYCVTAHDLDPLSVEDFRRMAAWLQGTPVPTEPRQPRPHQQEALDAILAEFDQQDRATAVMACGTGKTLVGCWTAQRLGARRVLILLPSLALVRQTLHEWAEALPQGDFAWQCVCSDQTVDERTDGWCLRQQDLDFPVTTDPQEVRRFLQSEFQGIKLVFSTYQSAAVVAQGMDKEQPFDLGVFDEAHRTAGRQGLKFGLALTDAHLPLRKRLFLTATPRHYDIRKRTRGGDLPAVYSMDDATVYGTVAHDLGVARAASLGIICPYKVVISVITDAEVRAERLRHSEVVIEGEAWNAEAVAARIGLAKAIERFGLRKLFTFHRSIADARSFASTGSPGAGQFLPAFALSHINGAMPMARRERLLQEFAEAPRALMTNARCLTEGVDVPQVDLVAFLAPKRSRVDIVQAVGRALRRARGKHCGYVFLPVLLQEDESMEAAVRRADFEPVWEVLQALREQDTVLADCLQLLSEDLGRGVPLDCSAWADRIEILGPEVHREVLQRAITSRCVEELGNRWDRRLGELRAFREEHGHCLVPLKRKHNTELAIWVGVQRTNQRKGLIHPERKHRLDALGFEWDPLTAAREASFRQLQDYQAVQGHCNVPFRWPANPELGSWVAAQRRFHRAGRLTPARVQRLEALGFVWNPAEADWHRRLAELRAFAETHGHCDVPQKADTGSGLGAWVNNQRQLKRDGRLPAERIRELEALGFKWNVAEHQWEQLFQRLAAFHQAHGHSQMAADHCDVQLRDWVVTLRNQRRKGQLTTERIRRLDQLGFVWNEREAQWGERMEELKAFIQSHGHTNVPQKYPENQAFATWVVKQRQMRRKGRLSAERIQQLESLGFAWQPHAATWDQRLQQLAALKAQGQPWNPPCDRQLAKWLKHQRQSLKKGAPSPERARKLRELFG